MNPSTYMSLNKTKFVHAMYTYLEFGFTGLKSSALFDHINLTFGTIANQICVYVLLCDLLADIYIHTYGTKRKSAFSKT